ncbi:hypothetical protein O181_029429 [Austropuccinia psidii MF-1]|uniref:Uncharacterized protein n=1 Tax=Austropuccinia psidii MF-1 TaxID=1389203 RepID=A0A9Q3H4J8_9BASI|nr:hypothetical protein [Austropuccinia psidii MF-1]
MPSSNIERYLWSKKDGRFGKEFPVYEAPTPDVTGCKHREFARWTTVGGPIPIGGSEELDGEDVEVLLSSAGNQSSTSPSQPASKISQIKVVPSTPRNFQPVLSTIPPLSKSLSTARPSLVPKVRSSPIPQPRNSPMITSQQLQPVASSSKRREEGSPFPFPATQVFQKRECWPIQATREDPNMENEGQDAVAR